MSSVDERSDFRVSDRLSERNELDRRFNRAFSSANVDALPSGRCLRPCGEGLILPPVCNEEGRVIEGFFSEDMLIETFHLQGRVKPVVVG